MILLIFVNNDSFGLSLLNIVIYNLSWHSNQQQGQKVIEPQRLNFAPEVAIHFLDSLEDSAE